MRERITKTRQSEIEPAKPQVESLVEPSLPASTAVMTEESGSRAQAGAEQAIEERSTRGAEHRLGGIAIAAMPKVADDGRSVQRQAAVAIQRDGPLTLQPPSLLQEPDPAAKYHLGGDQHLHLDPAIETMARQYALQQISSATLRPALSRVNLNVRPAAAPGGGGPAGPPITGPGSPPAVPTPAPVVPAGAGPDSPRPAEASDVIGAVMAIPAIDQGITNLQMQATELIGRDWRKLATGEKIGAVSTVAVIGLAALGGVASDPKARQLALSQLNGRVLPVPGVDWLHLEVNTGGDNLMVGMHVDVGQLLPKSFGFGPGSPTAIGGPPQPEPMAGQRQVDPAGGEDRKREPGLNVAQQIVAASAGGAPLDDPVRRRLEGGLEADLSGVRVHTGSNADHLARSVDAVAFTSGQDIFFRSGAFAPTSSDGYRLLAHEATHTLQQAAGPVAGTPVGGGIALSDPADPFERAAERAADVAVGREASTESQGTSHGVTAPVREESPSPAAMESDAGSRDGVGHNFTAMATYPASSAATVQRKTASPPKPKSDTAHVGGDPGEMTFLEGPDGSAIAPGEGGFSRRMLAETGERAEGFEGYSEARLVNVAPSLGTLDKQIKTRADEVVHYNDKKDEWGNLPSTEKLWANAAEWSKTHGGELESNRASEEEKVTSYNAWVPRANGFFTSLTRLDAMQSMLGVNDPKAMAAALTKGLGDAKAVGERLQLKHDQGGKGETLDVPAEDNSVADASSNATLAAKEMNTAYLGFQQTLLDERKETIDAEGESDRKRLDQINEVKQFVRNVGKTVDVTMSVVQGAPAALSTATTTVAKAGATVNSMRNKALINAGKAPRHNPTFVTTDEKGNMIVRNVQTGMDRPIEGGEQSASPAGEGFKLPTSVSDLLGTIADFAYAGEVREINMRLESIKTRCGFVDGAKRLIAIREKTQAFQDKLNNFALKCNEMQKRLQQRRQSYLEFGVQLDRFAAQDKSSKAAGQAPEAGGERYATIMTVVSGVREVLSIGQGATGGFDSSAGIASWAQGLNATRTKSPPRTDAQYLKLPDDEWRPLAKMYSQVKTFESNVSMLTGLFGSVESGARAMFGALHQGSGGSGGAY